MSYRPGELDQRIIIKRKVKTPDGMGGNTVTWSDLFTLWALAKPMGGSEKTDFDRVNGEAKYLFVVRNGYAIQDGDAVEWEGEFYNIRVRKQRKSRDMYLEIEAERGASQ